DTCMMHVTTRVALAAAGFGLSIVVACGSDDDAPGGAGDGGGPDATANDGSSSGSDASSGGPPDGSGGDAGGPKTLAVDPTWNGGAIAATPVRGSHDEGWYVATQADGKLLVFGIDYSNRAPVVARLSATGAL